MFIWRDSLKWETFHQFPYRKHFAGRGSATASHDYLRAWSSKRKCTVKGWEVALRLGSYSKIKIIVQSSEKAGNGLNCELF